MVTKTGTDQADILNGTADADRIDGGDGNDTINGLGGNDRLFGDAGADTIDGGDGADVISTAGLGVRDIGGEIDTVFAGDGDDSVGGGRGDKLDGGAGNDSVFISFEGNTAFNGTLSQIVTGFENYLGMIGSSRNDTIRVGALLPLYGFNLPFIGGGDGADGIYGGLGNDRLFGESGDDRLFGYQGNDTLVGGAGGDSLHGGAGDDLLEGADGADSLYGGSGNDVLVAELGDTADGGAGRDELVLDFSSQQTSATVDLRNAFAKGTSTFLGTTITSVEVLERLIGSAQSDVIYLGDGFDPRGGILVMGQGLTVQAGLGNDKVIGGATANSIDAGYGNDLVYGYGGNDWILGNRGTDTLIGGDGDDYISDGGGGDTISGGNGDDILRGGTYVDGGDGDDDIATDIVDSFAAGGAGNDKIRGSVGKDDLNGNAGNDTLIGGGGSDTLNGGDGNDLIYAGDTTLAGPDDSDRGRDLVVDTIDAGAGDDRVVIGLGDKADGGLGVDSIFVDLRLAKSAITIRFSTTATAVTGDGLTVAGFERLDGLWATNFNDVVELGDLFQTAQIEAGGGADRIIGNDQDNKLNGTSTTAERDSIDGNDVIIGMGGDDYLFGGSGNDTLRGGSGSDTLEGYTGGDTLDGGSGKDVMRGDNGKDRLIGGVGRDMMSGGTDADTFVFALGDTGTTRKNADLITDFSSTERDRIDLSAIDGNTLVAGKQAFAFIGSGSFSAAGQLRIVQDVRMTYIEGDVDGDGVADLAIALSGEKALVTADFVL